MRLRRAQDGDWNRIWPIVREVLSRGDTYAYPLEMDEPTARGMWMSSPAATYVAESGERILGTYYIKPNQDGPGSHVCNAGYMVVSSARGTGVGRAMCRHSLAEARKLGFRAMQFNCVVATNVGAIELWKKMGFRIVGTVPEAFDHPTEGLVDAHIMYRKLGVDG